MEFTKMHGLGNDYIYVNCLEEEVKEPSRIAPFLSDRHQGIGSDGLILIKPSDRADFKMEVFNADGSVAEMCGNGIRCVGKYVFDRGMTDKKELEIETLAGVRKLTLHTKARQEEEYVDQVTVSMGEPILQADQIPVRSPFTRVIDEPITINRMDYRMTAVSMGNPHAVVFVKHVKRVDVGSLGPAFEYYGRFPRRINTEFAEVIDSKTLRIRVWERGAGETLACGTGACAAAVAGVLNHLTEREVTVKLLGGDLKIEWRQSDNAVYMTGPARMVYDGEIEDAILQTGLIEK